MSRTKKVQAALRLMGNPYASLSLFDDTAQDKTIEPSFEQKREYFKKLENPHAYGSIFGETEDDLWQAAAKRDKKEIIAVLEKGLDEVLSLYKPYVAKNEWKRLMDYRPAFLERAGETPERAERVTNRLQNFKYSLLPDEKVEYNRAPAVRIISELDRILN